MPPDKDENGKSSTREKAKSISDTWKMMKNPGKYALSKGASEIIKKISTVNISEENKCPRDTKDMDEIFDKLITLGADEFIDYYRDKTGTVIDRKECIELSMMCKTYMECVASGAVYNGIVMEEIVSSLIGLLPIPNWVETSSLGKKIGWLKKIWGLPGKVSEANERNDKNIDSVKRFAVKRIIDTPEKKELRGGNRETRTIETSAWKVPEANEKHVMREPGRNTQKEKEPDRKPPLKSNQLKSNQLKNNYDHVHTRETHSEKEPGQKQSTEMIDEEKHPWEEQPEENQPRGEMIDPSVFQSLAVLSETLLSSAIYGVIIYSMLNAADEMIDLRSHKPRTETIFTNANTKYEHHSMSDIW